MRIACHVGECLSKDGISIAERRAAEALARCLVEDAVEQVRRELSKAIRHSKHLPREIALKIAHDIDSVACPFLEVTEVFSDSDWRQLVLTISRGARIAVARRRALSEGLAIALAEIGDSVVAETLAENPTAPMTPPVCSLLIERFASSTWILDKLADRDGLDAEIASRLYVKASTAARRKLSRQYNLTDYTDPISVEAEYAAIFHLARQATQSQLSAIVERLKCDDKLGHSFLLHALREGQLSFFEAALSSLTTKRLELVRSTIRHGGTVSVSHLLADARIPRTVHGEFWEALQVARSNLQELERARSA